MDPQSTTTPRLVDFDAFEHSKENIAPTPRGHSALALAKAFQPISHDSPQDTRSVHAAVRAQFEKDIASSTDLDDPLEVWLRYIKWTDETFPQGQNTESGIARLLERCATQFKNDKQYKSDPRYLRVWLAYSTYTDAPLDIFVFLQRNDIGQELALYYEEHAAVLEKMNRKRKADEVFQMGLLKEARPVDRLKRRYGEFQRRLQVNPPDPNEPSTPPAPLRTILGAHQVSAPTGGTSARPRPKIQVFTDTDEPEVRPGSGGWESIGTIVERKKENTLAPKSWAGEKLPMKGSSTSAPAERLVVFRDEV
jgi:checkpoint serine/threonine-protein kinase